MVFLSVQPDTYYFSWQIELMLFNFNMVGIPKKKIHVLIGYDSQRGLNPCFHKLMASNRERGLFFSYPDLRVDRRYQPSLRPHIIRQHLQAFPELEEEVIFYHDADIIFREQPDWDDLLKGKTWHVSDTSSYMDSKHLRKTGGEALFSGMCRVMNIEEQVVITADENCGGAQYLLKDTGTDFWEKVENDSTAIFCYLEAENNRKAEVLLAEGRRKSSMQGIQSWCADMWALYWNALKEGREVKISKELDFCWARNPISRWEETKILHYTGNISIEDKRYFRKNNYVRFPPYFDPEIKKLDPDSCSFPLLTLIRKYYADCIINRRINLRDVTFLIPVRVDAEGHLDNLMAVLRYLHCYFDTTVIIAEADHTARIDPALLPDNCCYYFLQDHSPVLFHTRINNFLIRKSQTPVIALCDTDAIVAPSQLVKAAALILAEHADMVIPYSGECVFVDKIFKRAFIHLLDPEVFLRNKGKFTTATMRYTGGCIFINREKFITAGLENEHITGRGPEELERVKRFNNLGYKVTRVEGPLFYLPHLQGYRRNDTYL